MRSAITFILFVLITFLLITISQAMAQKPVYCAHISREVKVDGSLEEWTGVPATSLEFVGWSLVRKGKQAPDPKDCSGVIYTMWDENSIYFAAEMVDDKHIKTPETGVSIYKGDSFVVWFTESGTIQFGCAETTTGLETWRWVYPNQAGWSKVIPHGHPEGVELAIVTSTNLLEKNLSGVIFEASVPVSELGVEPQMGKEIAFACSFGDPDNGWIDEDEAVVQWPSGWDWGEAEKFGKLVFSETTAVSAKNKLTTTWASVRSDKL
jgi:hypothetical protein